MTFFIRPAVPGDCDAIRELIQELADYENYPDGPKISAEVLRRDGFGDKPFFQCLVAVATVGPKPEVTSQVAGYAFYYFTYSTWEGKAVYMEDLFVTEDYRNQGIGTALWKAVAQEGLRNHCSRVDFSVLNWNDRSIKFYEDKGAVNITAREGWSLFRLKREAMEKLVLS